MSLTQHDVTLNVYDIQYKCFFPHLLRPNCPSIKPHLDSLDPDLLFESAAHLTHSYWSLNIPDSFNKIPGGFSQKPTNML